MHTKSDVKVALTVVSILGGLTAILIVGGLVAFVLIPDRAKDLWLIIGPIISASITALASYFAAERKNAPRRERYTLLAGLEE
jgi:hypothetical protein